MRSKDQLPSKPCVACGRVITWRRKWARDWEEVRYCSDGCRRAGSGDGVIGRQLEAAILSLLANRSADSSICPSEAARAVFPEPQWKDRMEDARRAARRLVAAGEVQILQGGRVVDPSHARGPIRIRKTRG